MQATPEVIQVEITNRCNLSCRMCPRTRGTTSSVREPGHMPAAIRKRVLEAVQACPRVFVIGFGEPTLDPGFLPFLNQLDSLDRIIAFSTNGTNVSRDLVRELAELRNLEHVNVSIDSPDPEIFRTIRDGDLSTALRGLRYLREGLDAEVDLTVTALLMASTLDSLFAFPPLLADIGVKTLNLGGMFETSPGLEEERPHHMERYTQRLNAIKAAGHELGIDVVFVCEKNNDKARLYHTFIDPSDHLTRRCARPWTKPYIDKDGCVFPCTVTGLSAVMGKLAEAPFQEIWQGDRFRQFRSGLLDGGPSLPAPCRGCSQKPVKQISPNRFRKEPKAKQQPTGATTQAPTHHENRQLNSEEIRAGKLRLESSPVQINIELTGVCNINPPCVFCSGKNFGHTYPPLDLGHFDRYESFLDRAERITEDSFGEPLSHPQLVDAAWRFTDNDQFFSFVTNGLLLNQQKAEDLAACGSRLGIHVSFNAAHADTFFKLTGKRFDLVVENVRRYVDVYRRRNGDAPFHLVLTFIVMKVNQHEVYDFVELAGRLGAPRVLLASLHDRPSVPLGDFGYDFRYEEEMVPYDELEVIGRRATSLAEAIGIECLLQWDATHDSAVRGFAEPGCEIPCLIPWRYLSIQEHTRKAFGCPYHRHPFGDLDTSSIDEIWNGPAAHAMRRELVEGKVPKLCWDVSAGCPLIMKARHEKDQNGQIEESITMGVNDTWHVGAGWFPLEYVPEPARWTSAEAGFRICRPRRGQFAISVALFHDAHCIRGHIELQGQTIGAFALSGPCKETLIFPLGSGEGEVDGRILIDQTWSPAAEGISDTRQLGMAVRRIWFEDDDRLHERG